MIKSAVINIVKNNFGLYLWNIASGLSIRSGIPRPYNICIIKEFISNCLEEIL